MEGNNANKVTQVIEKKLKMKRIIALISTITGSFSSLILIFFPIFIAIIIVLGISISGEANGGSGVASGSQECGFTISQTSLSSSEYQAKLEAYAKINSNFEIFARNANAIYQYAASKNINPELVAVRAYVEGGGTTTGSYNYWGMGCTNTGGLAACFDYSSFEEGYTDYINNISRYNSLADMMSKYSYIGKYWYNPGDSGHGGCYYAEYIYDETTMPVRVKNACSSSAPKCTTAGEVGCTATTEEDQEAYATWQVEKTMANAREKIFGLAFEEGVCAYNSGNIQSLSSYNLKGNNLKALNRQLTTAEITSLNTYINSEVDKAGYGTGEAIAAAGQALTYWLEQKGYYLQYEWGGGHGASFVGANTSWGKKISGNSHNGMDCSGFVSWAIRTACSPSYGSKTTSSMKHGTAISVTEAKPGDLMLNPGQHVSLVIKNNGDGSVIVAEEYNSDSGLIFNKYKTQSGFQYIDMSKYYQTNCSSSR